MLKLQSIRTQALVAMIFGLGATTAFAAGPFAAIAYDKTTQNYGRWQGGDDQATTIANALTECQNADTQQGYDPSGCMSVGWAGNYGWVALARGDGGHFATGSVHNSQENADNASLARCATVTTNCKIVLEATAQAANEQQ